MAKHDSLRQFLDHKGTRMLTLSFSQIADLVGGLPESAYQYREWWANQVYGVQARSWTNAGWRVDRVSLSSRRVTFTRL
jgi:hypothetical protein